jgi:hypothetical protein
MELDIERKMGHERNWAEYMAQMTEHVNNKDWYHLQELLREPHPLLPGEKEAYQALVEDLGPDHLTVQLDETEYHVIPKEQAEDESSPPS